MTTCPIVISPSLLKEPLFGDGQSMPNQEKNHYVWSKTMKENLLVPGFPASFAAMGTMWSSLLSEIFTSLLGCSWERCSSPIRSRRQVRKHLSSFHALGVVIGDCDALRAPSAVSGQVGKPRKLQRHGARTLLIHSPPLNFYYVI